ncbi:rCG55233 [Rattus norvegicus]|uniref:RCG55233 n=1 Tax=Rattus norvegicus TaxID=10116 RepID=A6J866_RAT|nr:rCG55233 [Rattus norvegicus]
MPGCSQEHPTLYARRAGKFMFLSGKCLCSKDCLEVCSTNCCLE